MNSKYSKYYTLLLVLVMLLGIAAQCSEVPATAEPAVEEPAAEEPAAEEPAAEEPAAEEPAATDKEKLYFEISALANIPYFIDHQVGLKFAGEVLGAEVKYVGPIEYDMTAMVNAFEQAIAEEPDGINVIGFDAALKPTIGKSIDAGIPTVTLDAEVYDSKRQTFLGTGNYNAGRVGGKLLAEAIGGQGKVAMIYKVGQSNLEERSQGYQDEFAENYPDIELVQIIDGQSDPAKSADGLKAVLQRTPDLAGVGCVDAGGGVGAATAVKELGLEDQVTRLSGARFSWMACGITRCQLSAITKQPGLFRCQRL
jgi:ribose transport system substrate-binding protein